MTLTIKQKNLNKDMLREAPNIGQENTTELQNSMQQTKLYSKHFTVEANNVILCILI